MKLTDLCLQLFPQEDVAEATGESARKRAVAQQSDQRTEVVMQRVQFLEDALRTGLVGDVAVACADELAAQRRDLLRLQGNSDKLLREIDELTQKSNRIVLLRRWARG